VICPLKDSFIDTIFKRIYTDESLRFGNIVPVSLRVSHRTKDFTESVLDVCFYKFCVGSVKF
jgi:hypothetical protein